MTAQTQDNKKNFWDQIRRRAFPLVIALAVMVLLVLMWQHYWSWMDLSCYLKSAEKIKAQIEAIKTLAQVLGGGVLF